ncbi:MAG: hypothetical protein AUG49_19640 [Catenulispora sp. 13_1_20CM_3_70_7]|nr:MAG: hypothetical protein AUG49_19640 [Catenulispora sp. 13_1_20CM_3_70_7]
MTTTARGVALAHGPRLYDVPEVCQRLRLSRSVVYELIRAGRLRSVKEGNCRRISERAVQDYIDLLEREATQN